MRWKYSQNNRVNEEQNLRTSFEAFSACAVKQAFY